ncbi:MAG TPA: phage holin family protein [Candidatus Paceibacterota bacterium]|nr:phage holin family protein [Candidatus Paceibacterota bacterium]
MLIRAVVHILATAVTLLLMTSFVPGIAVENFYTALVVAIFWGLMGLTIRPILTILTLPITIITFGLFSFVLNAFLFWLLSTFIEGFSVAGFIPALLGSAILSAVSWILHRST